MCLNIRHRFLSLSSGDFFSSHMAAESARGSEFAQSMADHVFGNIDRNVSASIMHSDRMSYHLREDHAGTTPGAQHFLLAFLVHRFNSLQKFRLNKRALFQ